ncbi:transposase [Prescottella sp. R16]|uniref:transposase n=1 Tax=Prescottella sp. R16 TaxID=3064529 RepID=UPI00272ED2EE|nr:transposase [Prescottella sp. R16]
MRQDFPEPAQHYRRAQRLWPGSYFAGSVEGAPISVLRQHIEQQERPVQGTLGPRGPTACAFTSAVNGGALAHIPVAGGCEVPKRGRRVVDSSVLAP